ncbi:MAG TPA: alpha/beta hydrolase [Nocardioides sp.]|uniref:alpha/beta hydrolase n=1 Tax=Nocardioides sp. TaxID=35761 RepID=UPI002CF36928|nr:alpha/beta hydrolase [Nocardioides sp.]HQR26018.1 alpha/beta hydrolase [Nocardioides sp.]
MTSRLPLGVHAVDRLMKANPALSVANMTAEQLARVQATVIPDGGLASLVLGRLQRGVSVETTAYDAPHGPVPLRVYTPTRRGGPRPVVLNIHGGGFALGSARQCDWSSSVVARDLDAVVVSVDYRLAPTHRFPAAVEDCYGALLWVHEHASRLGGDPSRIGVMGDSAGGNLAAVVAIMVREQGGPVLRHQALLYPATDLTDEIRETPAYRRNDHGIVLSHADLDVFHRHYVTDDLDPYDWRLSPLRAPDLTGLPPAVVVVAGLDPLHDAGVQYAEALAAAGVPVVVEDFHRMPHGFLSFPYLSRSARPAMAAVVRSQRAALGSGF